MADTTLTRRAQMLDLGLTILRLVIGVVFVVHGYQKLFGMGIGNVTGFFTQAGVPLPGLTAPLVSVLEFFGGLALIAGVLTRFVGLALAIDMLGAILFVKLSGGFSGPKGFEFELVLLAASAALALTGAGAYSVDRGIAERRGSTSS